MKKRDALLALLSDGRPHNQHEVLRAAGYRYTGRMKELRDAGHNIESTCIRHPNVWSYRLILPVKPKQGALL